MYCLRRTGCVQTCCKKIGSHNVKHLSSKIDEGQQHLDKDFDMKLMAHQMRIHSIQLKRQLEHTAKALAYVHL